MKTHWTEWDIQHPQISGSPGFYGVLGRENPMEMTSEEMTEYDRLKAQKTEIERRQRAKAVPTEEESRKAFEDWWTPIPERPHDDLEKERARIAWQAAVKWALEAREESK